MGGFADDMCCLLVLDSVTSTPQWIRQPRPRVYLKEGTYHTRLFRGPSTNDMKKEQSYPLLAHSSHHPLLPPPRRPLTGPTPPKFIGNAANQYKLRRYIDVTNTAGSGIYGVTNTLMTVAQLNSEFRPYYQVNANYMYCHDYTVIKLNHLFESLNKMGKTI
jgi:hypothetical protein